MAEIIHAYAWRSGQIAFGTTVPTGAISVMRGTEPEVRDIVEVCARHSYDGKTLLVPGVPEAVDNAAAADALEAFINMLAERDSVGVRAPAEAAAEPEGGS